MTKIRTLFVTLILALVVSGSARAGETLTPPCIPGETSTPPCSAPVSSDSTIVVETQTSSNSVDIGSLTELALDMLLF
jgi:hypothetical protein